MIDEVRNLLDQYRTWLQDRTVLREVRDWIEITTPYLDRHNDSLQIYVKRFNDSYLLTDDGYILSDLESSGCNIEGAKRKAIFDATVNGFGVQCKGGALQVQATEENFGLRKHSLLQAMLAVNDLFYLASPVVSAVFREDVTRWLDVLEIRYTQNVKFSGTTGYDHLFDFVIPKSKQQPERLLRTFNRPGRNAAQAMVFSWLDTKGTRSPGSCAYAILNDAERSVPEAVQDAMRNYDVRPILWSEREDVSERLAA